jgi:hypothetical protein
MSVNSIHAGSVDADPAKWGVTQGMIETEIAKVRKAKAEHSGESQGPKRRIGFSYHTSFTFRQLRVILNYSS